MNYLLVENRQRVYLNMPWRQNFFQRELHDLGITYTVLPVATGYIKINDTFEIIPVTESTTPPHDSVYEQLSGPFYTYTTNSDGTVSATEKFVVITNSHDNARGTLKQQVTRVRQQAENTNIQVTVQGKPVTVNTSMQSRSDLLVKHMLMSSTETASHQFPEGWMTLSQDDIKSIAQQIHTYVQSHVNWEMNLHTNVDDAKDHTELKTLSIQPPK